MKNKDLTLKIMTKKSDFSNIITMKFRHQYKNAYSKKESIEIKMFLFNRI